MLARKTATKPRPRKAEWRIEDRPVAYDRALAYMEAKAGLIRDKGDHDLVWLLEHPPVYTAGTSAEPADLLNPRFPVYSAGRGGQYTYHGPGQRLAYVVADLQRTGMAPGPDLKAYIHMLEEWVIETLKTFDVTGERRKDRVGIWIDMKPFGRPRGTEAKIAAIGVRVKKWVAYHGVSINLNPDLSHYDGIIPCGIKQHGVTSLKELSVNAAMPELDKALRQSWEKVF